MTDHPDVADEPYSPVDLNLPVRVNWRALIIRLERRRMRHIDIATAVGRSESWVGRLKNGDFKEPPYSVGQQLLELDSRETHNPQV